MKHIKSIIRFAALLLLMVCAQTVKAQQTYIMVHKVDGTVLRIAVADVDSVTFREWTGPIFSYEYVDLGLSVKWATCNVGAQSPEQTGGYFAWGETEEKDGCYYDNYKFTDSDGYYTKYNLWQSVGKVDMKYRLDPEDDVAFKLLGDGWRTPTREEFQELLDNCNWTPATMNGVQGYRVTSEMNNNSIFIPLTGESWQGDTLGYNKYAHYYSNTLSLSQVNSASNVYSAYMYYSSDDNYGWYMANYNRVGGLAIRPVYSSSWEANIVEVKELSIDKSEVSIEVGQSINLYGSVVLQDSSEMRPEWKSSNAMVARVDYYGNIFGVTEGQCMIYASYGIYSDSCLVTVLGFEQEMEYVDLGLSVNWATCNIGASRPERVGLYYAWGETEVKSEYSSDNYKYADSEGYLTKYCQNPSYGVDGFVDELSVLELADDAAHVIWGDDWRMPTYEEITELIENCDFEWYNDGEIQGYYVTSRVEGYQKSSIFIPYSEDMGASCFWTSSVAFRRSDYALLLADNTNRYTYPRWCGVPIRPVCPNENYVAPTLELSSNELAVVVGKTSEISAFMNDSWIDPTNVTWISSDTTVATIDIYGIITAKAEGTTTITATYKDQSDNCIVTVIEASSPTYVDLGLSVKWATFNVGATAPFEIGDSYAWGAIDTTSNYSWESYRFFTGYNDDEEAQVSKYVTNSYYGENVDNLTVLESADDVASVKWGGNWRIPTRAEIEELINLCEWEWTEHDGVYGYKVTSRVTGFMDRSIFLPEYFWSSSLFESNALGAYALDGQKIGAYYRWSGLAIRPVYTFDVTDIAGLMLDKSVVALALGSEVIVNASPVSVDGRAIAVNEPLNLTWSSGDPEVATVTDGKIKAVGAGKCVVTVAYGGETYEVSVTVEDPSQVAPESVDLGLSVKWATFNLGAFQPEMTGDFYSWGEAEPYYEAGNALSTSPVWKEGKDAGYTWSSYFDTDDKGKTFNKYSAESGRKVLDLADDAANLAWGGKWRIPTSAEFQELIDNCSWSYEELNGVKGYRITSKEEGYENNSIFMPIAGYRSGKALYDDEDNEGYYWSSSIDVAASSVSVMCLTDMEMYNIGKIYGFLYRPVEMYDDSEIQGLIISETKYELGIGNTLALTVQGDLDGHAISLSGTAVWSSSDDSVATVVDGVVKAVGAGVATITASYNGQEVYCSITVFDQYDVETEYVDLGLSVNWATFNLGANKPEMKGEYFAWGETSPKSVYTQDTYKFNSDSLRKYGDDGKYILDSEDDAAQVLWGGSWRMPTADEFQELIDNCSWTLTELDGVNGYLVTSKITGYTDKFIFLPITGSIRGNTEYNDEGYYWASTMNPDDETSIADYLYLDNQSYSVWRYYRYQGRTIRPVCPNPEYVDKVVLTDDATVLVNETVDGEPVYKAAPRIVADPADSTNNCIIVTAPSYPENYYDAQLYITVSDSVELLAGAILELSFRYKADNSVDCATEIHSVPGEWAGEGPGYIYFSPRWQKYSISTSVMDPDQRVFVINLAYLEEGNNFYFDDIAVTIVDNMADGFILNTNTLIRTVGEYGYLYAHDNAGNELNQFTQWVSTNDSVAVVNSFGEVRAIGEGTCYILASYRDYKDSCEIIVNGSNEDPYLELKYHQLPLMVGESFYISYNTNVNDDIYWESSNRNIVSVDKEGVITAESTGSCIIIATVGNLSDSCLVIVRNEEQEYVDTLVSHDFVVKDDSVFFYCYNSNVGYEMLATFAETDSTDYMVCTGLYASVAYKTAEEAQQAYADMTSGMSEEQIQSYNFRLIDDEGIYGITYNYPTVIGMDRDAVLAMMYQSYNSMIGGPEGQQEGPGEYEEPGYIGKVQAFLPAEYADSNAVAAWYMSVDEQENRVKYETVFLFEDGSLVVTKSKFYTKADGRDPELEILAIGQYELTDGDFDNGIASVILSDGSVMDVEIDGGVLYAMNEAYVKQKNDMLPEPTVTH